LPGRSASRRRHPVAIGHGSVAAVGRLWRARWRPARRSGKGRVGQGTKRKCQWSLADCIAAAAGAAASAASAGAAAGGRPPTAATSSAATPRVASSCSSHADVAGQPLCTENASACRAVRSTWRLKRGACQVWEGGGGGGQPGVGLRHFICAEATGVPGASWHQRLRPGKPWVCVAGSASSRAALPRHASPSGAAARPRSHQPRAAPAGTWAATAGRTAGPRAAHLPGMAGLGEGPRRDGGGRSQALLLHSRAVRPAGGGRGSAAGVVVSAAVGSGAAGARGLRARAGADGAAAGGRAGGALLAARAARGAARQARRQRHAGRVVVQQQAQVLQQLRGWEVGVGGWGVE
jgi:hypothetical protein